jgi:hypothetical protein
MTTAELLVVLCSSGDAFLGDEVKRLATSVLLFRREDLSGVENMPPLGRDDDYAQLVHSFVEDLASHRAPTALAEQFSVQVNERLAEELRGRFLERMRSAIDAGVVSASAVPMEDALEPEQHAFGRHFSLAGRLIAIAFMTWIAGTRGAQAADESRHLARADGNAARTMLAQAEEASAERIVANHLRVFNEASGERRIRAIESLAALGPKASAALPALRRELAQASDELRRGEAAYAIGYIAKGERENVAALQGALSNPSPRVRRIAALALGNFGKASAPALTALRQANVAPAILECITNETAQACELVGRMLNRESPLLRLRIEHELNAPGFGGGGACMCSLR